MSPHDKPIPVDAFVDGELDLAAQLDIEARLRVDAGLQRQVDEARQLRDAVRDKGEYHAAPAALHGRMTALLAATEKPPAAAPRGSAAMETLGRWLGWRPLAASAGLAAVLAVAANLVWLQASDEARLHDEVVASHVRSTLGQHLVDVSSSDHHTVKPFLSSKLGFSPPVDALALPGSAFLGGRVDYLDGRPVAALVYRQGQHIVNSFVWPSQGSNSAPAFSAARGYRTAHWTNRGMTHWVISDVNRDEFLAVVNAVQRTDAAR